MADPKSAAGVGDWLRHKSAAPHSTEAKQAPVGGLILAEGEIEINAGRPTVTLKVRNTGDRPVQVGSHFHFFEVNPALEFDRAAAFGRHLHIPASTALRFEPGDEREVRLVPYGGKRGVFGFNNLVDGATAGEFAEQQRAKAMALATQRGFRSSSNQR